jgi:RNA polymerase sigma-70 factor (ECF subfamily)
MQIATLETGAAEPANPLDVSAEALIGRYLTRVHRFAVMVSPRGAEAEDLAQQALLRALEAVDSFDPRRGTLDAWLWRIVVNVGRDAGRVVRRKELLVERLARDRSTIGGASPEVVALDQLRDRELIAAVRELPRRYRSLIALRYGAGLSSEEIAHVLGTTRMAVAKATRRALDMLRARLVAIEVET